MARSKYAYVVHDGSTGGFIGAWTVKSELESWIAQEVPESWMIEVLRVRDGQPHELAVALNPRTLEPAI